MNWKRIVAREWLYILGFAVCCGSAVFLLSAFFQVGDAQYPVFGKSPSFEMGDWYQAYVDSLEQLETKYGRGDEYDGYKNQLIKYLPDDVQAWYEWEQDSVFKQEEYKALRRESDWAGRLAVTILLFPYPLFMLARSVLWAIKQVRIGS